jgi:acetyl-CoA carboxylase biotin carboxyl carrier protein
LEKITEHQEELAKSERQRPALEQAVSSATQELDEFLRQSSAWRTNGSATGAEKPAAAPAEKLHEVTSPIVGTFFDSASPGKPTFVKIGDHVEVGQVLCIVEAMNLMNEIVSDVAGEVVKRIAASGQPVENGQPLFAIRPR